MEFDLLKYSTGAIDWFIAFLPGALMAIATVIIGFWIANKVDDIVEKALERSSLSPELTSFLGSMSTVVVKGIALMLAAGFVGFNTASLIGILAAGAFAIGFALQGSLSNFAAGILILLFKPFRVGDWISASDVFGKVEEIQILSTIVAEVGIGNYDSHNIILSVRPYVEPDNYWEATYEINRLIKNAMHRANIPMAYSEGVELGKIGA